MTGRREEGAGRRSPSGSRRGDAAKGGAAGPWVAAPLYAASLTTGGAFGILFAGGSRNPDAGFLAEAGGGTWLPLVVAALVAALAGSAGGLRFVLVLPAAALYAPAAVYGPGALLSVSGLPELLARIAGDAREAAITMYAEPAPYDPAPGLLLVLIPAVMVVVALAVTATLHRGSPVVSVALLGLTIGILSTVSLEDGAGPFFAVFLVSSVLLLLFAGVRSGVPAGPRLPALVVAIVVAGAVLALPRSPLAEAVIKPALVDWRQIGQVVGGGPAGLDVRADVGNYLKAGRETELFRVRSEEPLLWRGGTLDRFDGVRWSSTVRPGADAGEEIAPGVETRRVAQSVRISDARTGVIFGGYRILSVWGPDATPLSDGSWASEETLSEDSRYRVVSEVPQPTEGQLHSAGTTYPAEVEEKYLQLPNSLPEEIPETARRIEDSYATGTPYQKARAIERYLLYDGGFTYNLDVDYGRADRALEEFLGDGREGFCVQFATSMVLILREMDVPARLVYGARPGEEVAPGEYVIRGKNMHTWVEVYFPGVGWYPFDPTPGFGLTPTMEENAPRAGSAPAPETGTPAQQVPGPRVADGAPLETPMPQSDADTAGGAPSQDNRRSVTPVAYLLAFAGLLAGVPVLKRARAARGTPEALYRDVLNRLEDAAWPQPRRSGRNPEALTPVERLSGAARVGGLDPAPFEDLAWVYSEHLYAPEPVADVRKAHRRAVRALAALPRWRRLLGAFNPTSLSWEVRTRTREAAARAWRGARRAFAGDGERAG
ncbi:MAG: transglutaminase domain-containing protein [Actinomycetota bacterium]|uniref:transglutaminase family protein n=1 Tax=Rubrobacter xylanophilus TaxID=49319 RepID=UPI001C641DCF|nr:transglutaminase domain-containing protein [Rubrobacter xylanophilus]QYJ17344.1 hypothetical protein Rxycam_03192 [Rubrobacter xylanophilus DSM 9941]